MAQDIIGTKDGMNFFVGSPTPTPTRYTEPAAPAPAPTATAPAPTPKTSSSLPSFTNDPAANYYNSLREFNPADEAKIKDRIRTEMQASLDAIDKKYVSKFADEARAGAGRTGETRALGARSGLLGSDFGMAQKENTNQFNKQQVNTLEAQKQQEIMAVQLQIKQLSNEEIAARKQEALGKFEGLQKLQEKARTLIPIIAQSGVALSPEQKKALAKQTGYDELTFDTLYNYNKKLGERGETTFHTIKNEDGSEQILGITLFPDGRVEQKSYGGLNTGGKPIKIFDGVPYVMDRDEAGNPILTPVQGFAGKQSASYVEWQNYKKEGGKLDYNSYMNMDANRKAVRSSTTVNYGAQKDAKTAAALGQVAPAINALVDPNSKYIDARAYKDLYAKFVQNNPGQGDMFLQEFPLSIYINPADMKYFPK